VALAIDSRGHSARRGSARFALAPISVVSCSDFGCCSVRRTGAQAFQFLVTVDLKDGENPIEVEVEFHSSQDDETQAMQARQTYELIQAFLNLL
jgi:hypothetical protein